MNRRAFLTQVSVASALAALPRPLTGGSPGSIALPKGKAEHCIFIWLGGGMSQIDTFDPKRRGNRHASPSVPGTDYGIIDTAIPGLQFTEHLPNLAKLADRMTILRTVHHALGSEHALATNFVHTGRPISGSTVYPAIGSVVALQRGAMDSGVPPYVLMGYPSPSRGSGFLGARHNFVYLLDTESGPSGFTPAESMPAERIPIRQALLRKQQAQVQNEALTADYAVAQLDAFRLAGPGFMRNFNLAEEPGPLRQRYGSEFGQRCLLARRLVQAGVRFVEVSQNLNFINGIGWDTHNMGQNNQHVLIQDLDTALSALIIDLEKHGLLDKTLIALGTEFGRPAEFDSGGGRGHQASCFSLLLAGGGLNHRGSYGVSDDYSRKPQENPVSIPDYHATIYAALGIDPAKDLLSASRPVPITDGGKPIAALFS